MKTFTFLCDFGGSPMPIREGLEEKNKGTRPIQTAHFFYGKGLQESFAFIILKKKKSIFLLSIIKK